MKKILQIFRQDGHFIRFRNRCFFIARKMFCQVILCNFFRWISLDVLSGRHFVRIEDYLGHYFGTSYELLGLDPTFGLL